MKTPKRNITKEIFEDFSSPVCELLVNFGRTTITMSMTVCEIEFKL